MKFLYDGTYPGFLTAVYEVYHFGTSRLEDIRVEDGRSRGAGEEDLVKTDTRRADQVGSAFRRDCGKEAARLVYHAFLSDEPGRELKLFDFMRRGFRLKRELHRHAAGPWYRDVAAMARETEEAAEAERAALRFQELPEGALLALIRPSCNVLPLLAPRLAGRVAAPNWAVCDMRRYTAAVYDHGTLSMAIVPRPAEARSREARWRAYYRPMGTDAAAPAVLPERYWPYLGEE